MDTTDTFEKRLKELLKSVGKNQKDLVEERPRLDELAITASALNKKLKRREGKGLSNDEVKGIVKRLAGWGAFKKQSNAIELLELADRSGQALTPEEWHGLGLGPRPIRIFAPGTKPPLPAATSPLVGRETEVKDLRERLLDPAVRLLTLTGPGGVSKTRLAQEVATGVEGRFGDGAGWADLSEIRDGTLVLPAIARSVGMSEEAKSLAEHLAHKRMLLVVDNLEQVLLPAGNLLKDLLSAVPGLKVLATSRAPLRIRGEHEYTTLPLKLPVETDSEERIRGSEAVRLFLDRARARKHNFNPGGERLRSVARICALLDGLPLAIELAAARVKAKSLGTILDGLDDRLDFVEGDATDLPDRQRTMRATIEWSYDLLTPSEQCLFARLAVFAGGCTEESAQVVCGLGLELGVEQGLNSLVDWSLLRQDEGPGGEPRYGMLGTIRQYAREKLERRGEAAELRTRHAEYFRDLAERAEPELRGPDQVVWLDRLQLEHDNLRAVLGFSLDSGDVDVGLQIAAAVWEFWYVRGYLTEGRGWLSSQLAHCGERVPAAQARVLLGAGVLAWSQGEYEEAERLLKASLDVSREVEDTQSSARALVHLGIVAADRGDYDEAHNLYEQSLVSFHDLGDEGGVGLALNCLGDVARRQSDYVSAERLFTEGLARCRNVGHKQGVAWALENLADMSHRRGEYELAGDLYAQCLAMFTESGDKRGIAQVLNELGRVANDQGDYGRAADLLGKSLTLSREMDDKAHVITCLEGLAGVAYAHGHLDRTVCLYGAVAAIRDAQGMPLPPGELTSRDHILASIREVLGGGVVTAAWAQGRAMTMRKATEYALSASASTP